MLHFSSNLKISSPPQECHSKAAGGNHLYIWDTGANRYTSPLRSLLPFLSPSSFLSSPNRQLFISPFLSPLLLMMTAIIKETGRRGGLAGLFSN